MTTQVERAAAWATGFRLADAPADVVELTQAQVANILAAMVAGSASLAGERVRRALLREATTGTCTSMPHGDRLSLWDALYLHAAYANALELDDFHFRGHLGPAAVVVPLTLGALLGSSGAASLRAQIIANELGGRLGWAITAEIRHGHQRSYLLRFAAAAAAAALLELDRTRFARALAISLSQPELPLHPGMFSPDTKVLSAAPSVVEGVRAAFLAEAGLEPALDVLEHPAGFYRQFTLHRHVTNPFVQFGEAWCTHALSFKRYSACAYAAGAVEAACALRAHPDFNPELDEIAAFEVGAPLPALLMERLAEPHEARRLTPVNVQFSIVRSVAAALVLGDVRGFHYRAPEFARLAQAVAHVSARGRIMHLWPLTIEQLRGIDAGLPDGGGGRSADMFQFYRTSAEFRRMFGTVRAISPADLIRIVRLRGSDRSFFVRRWQRSLRNHLRAPADPERQVGDLRRLAWKMGGHVTVRWRDGRSLSHQCVLPTGMAGSPHRLEMVRDKLCIETADLLGVDRCTALQAAIDRMQATPIADVVRHVNLSQGGC